MEVSTALTAASKANEWATSLAVDEGLIAAEEWLAEGGE